MDIHYTILHYLSRFETSV